MKRMGAVLLTVLCLSLVPVLSGCGSKKQVPPPAPTRKEAPQAETVKPAPQEKPAEVAPRGEGFEDINFDYDKYSLTPTALRILSKHAKELAGNPEWTVRIEGHCDERGTVEYNLALGEKRAAAARAFLIEYGVPAENITTVSYGKERPKDARPNEEGWAINRRAEFHVSK
jgi:peptidoglycan-associated lipoprotein